MYRRGLAISNYIDRLAQACAEYIYKRVGRTPVYKLKLSIKDTIYYLMFCTPIVAIGIATGRILESLIAPLLFSYLRQYSGGLHLFSPIKCAIVSALMVLIAIYTPGTYWYNGLVYNLIALILIAIYAPAGSRAPERYHRPFKRIAVVIVMADFILQSHYIALIFVLQSLTIIPLPRRWGR